MKCFEYDPSPSEDFKLLNFILSKLPEMIWCNRRSSAIVSDEHSDEAGERMRSAAFQGSLVKTDPHFVADIHLEKLGWS